MFESKRSRNNCAFIVVLTLCFILICNVKVLASVTKDLKFSRLSIEDGLSQGSVEALIQDSRGYMWFCTSDGLNRYDGKNFKIYKFKADDENSISSNYISSIIEDNDGDLWVATNRGLSKINGRDNDDITRIPVDKNSKTGLSNYNIWTMIQDKEGYIWISTDDGLNRYNKNTKNFEKYYYEKDNSNSLTNSSTTALCEDDEGNIWIGTKDGLNVLDIITGKITRYSSKDGSISDNYIKCLTKDSNGDIWIGTNLGGINKYNSKDKKIDKISYKSITGKSDQSKSITDIVEDSNKNIWIGTQGGLIKLNGKTNDIEKFNNKIYDTSSLVSDEVLSICEDRSGIIWIGTYNGISLLNPYQKFMNYKKVPLDNNSLTDNMISGIVKDRDNLIWIGTNNGLNCLDLKTGNVKHYLQCDNSNSLSNNRIWGVTEDRDGDIWIATSDGLNLLNKKTGKFTNFFADESGNSINSNETRVIYQDSDGLIWIGSRDGLNSFDKKTGQFKSYTDLFLKNGILDQHISCIYEDNEGIMWLGCAIEGGLIRIDKQKESIKNYKNNPNDPESIIFDSIKCITPDCKGNLWIATNNGINKFNKKTEKFIPYNEDNGLSNNFTYGILIDDDGNPWISSNSGISKFDINKNTFINFDLMDGLQGNEFNGYSFFKSKDGEFFFGGINGLNSFFPSKIEPFNFKSKVVIESFKVNGQNKTIESDIKLKYNQNNFSFEFFLPDYRNTSKITYDYKLEGVDKNWIYSGDRNYANYTNLNEGYYTFKVRARNSNGVFSELETVNVIISNPPWKSPIAYFLYILIILLVIFFVWNYVNILEKLVEQRTIELNNKLEENLKLYDEVIKHEKFKNTYFVNLSHELRTPLNVILSTVQLITKLNEKRENISKESLSKYIGMIKRNSNSLLKVINDLIDSSKIEAGSYKIKLKENNIVYVVEEVALSMKNYIEGLGLELIIDPEIEEKIIKCDETEIERCIVNLLSNAAKYTPEGGCIYVYIEDKDNYVSIIVKDTGIGIAKEHQRLIFDRFGQVDNESIIKHCSSGIGLTLVKYLVDMHNGTIEVESEINKGTTFTIKLPTNPEPLKKSGL